MQLKEHPTRERSADLAPPLYWRNAGTMTYLADVDGRIAGVLYFDEGVLDGDQAGDALDASWWWVPSDAPGHHAQVDAPLLRAGMTVRQVEDATYAAFDAACRMSGYRKPAGA